MSLGCFHCRAQLAAIHAGHASEAARLEVEAHLSECEGCREEQARWSVIGELKGSYSGPKKLKSSGKAAGSKKKKSDKHPEKKPHKKADSKPAGKKTAKKAVPGQEAAAPRDGSAPLRRKPL